MANTLTGLIPTLYAGMETVSRELIGFIPNVRRDASAEMAAKDQTISIPVAPAGTAEDITPGVNPADSGDNTFSTTDVTISKSRAVPIRWNGEEQLSTTEYGIVNTLLQQQFEQAFRTLANEVESDLAALYAKTSRAYGTAGTAPFGTADDMTDLSNMHKILDDNGTPAVDRAMVLGSTARAQLEGKQSHLFKANEAGDVGFRQSRINRDLIGFTMGYSGQVVSHVKGAGTGYDINNASNEAVGQTTLTLDGGTVNTTGIKAGDIVTFAGDSNKYVVTTGGTAVAGDIVLAEPGLRVQADDDTAMTIGDSYAANMAFHRDAIVLLARQPAMPLGGDAADDVEVFVDPVSGLAFQIAVYSQYRQIKYEVGLAWGVENIKPEHTAILLG